MKLLSFDVGIKNLAYCIIEYKNDKLDIIDWNIINLCKKNNFKCKYCFKNAKFNKDDLYYCNTHAKKEKFIIPTSETNICNINKLNKLNLNLLREKAKEFDISYNLPILKDNLLNLIKEYINNNYFQVLKEEKADDFNLIELGISLKNHLDLICEKFKNINYILIENQISPIASRMKTIQGMLAQYFIMKNLNQIEFISSQNKLKYFIENKNTTYNERKKLSIETCKDLLLKYNQENISFFINHKKKDDLADCFLQSFYFFINKKIINI
tara:strand:- start:9345 stop:10151 length:807 start_codon:yes stop_codon:yes gene_type:complete